MKVNSKIFQNLNFENFPFIKQNIEIKLYNSEFTADELVYKIDRENSGINSDIHIENWKILGYKLDSQIETFESSFGHPDITNAQGRKHSVMTMDIELSRGGWKLFI